MGPTHIAGRDRGRISCVGASGELLGPLAAVIQGGAQNELRHFRSKFPPAFLLQHLPLSLLGRVLRSDVRKG
jgi:hypothetical protein